MAATAQTETSAASGPGSVRSSRGDRDLRATILQVAGALFAQRGYNATSVREVVEAAGCTKPSLYYYFRNKEQLFLEVIRDGTERMNENLEDALKVPGSLRERFHRGLSQHLDFVRDNPTTLRLLLSAERRPDEGQPAVDFASLRQHYVALCRDMLLEGQQTGEVRADIDATEAALAFFGMVDHRFALHLHGQTMPDGYAEQILDLFFRGIRP